MGAGGRDETQIDVGADKNEKPLPPKPTTVKPKGVLGKISSCFVANPCGMCWLFFFIYFFLAFLGVGGLIRRAQQNGQSSPFSDPTDWGACARGARVFILSICTRVASSRLSQRASVPRHFSRTTSAYAGW